jgi:Fe2+ or Zn2+ uptake regulation protein
MSTKFQQSSDPIDQYITEHSLRLTPQQKEIIEYTKKLPGNYLLYSIIKKNTINLFY